MYIYTITVNLTIDEKARPIFTANKWYYKNKFFKNFTYLLDNMVNASFRNYTDIFVTDKLAKEAFESVEIVGNYIVEELTMDFTHKHTITLYYNLSSIENLKQYPTVMKMLKELNETEGHNYFINTLKQMLRMSHITVSDNTTQQDWNMGEDITDMLIEVDGFEEMEPETTSYHRICFITDRTKCDVFDKLTTYERRVISDHYKKKLTEYMKDSGEIFTTEWIGGNLQFGVRRNPEHSLQDFHKYTIGISGTYQEDEQIPDRIAFDIVDTHYINSKYWCSNAPDVIKIMKDNSVVFNKYMIETVPDSALLYDQGY